MRPGITIAHSNEVNRSSDEVRNDITGFIAAVPRQRWWPNARPGDFCELNLNSFADLARNRHRGLFDPVTVRAIKAYFANGGRTAKVFGLAMESSQDLAQSDPFGQLFIDLIGRLRAEEDVALLTMPALCYLPIDIDRRGRATFAGQTVIELLLEHCREMNNRFLILDAPRDLHDKPLMRWVNKLRDDNVDTSAYGAIYYPWLMNGDEVFPPSGSVAGIYAKVEHEHQPMGIRWPPANEVLEGVTHPSVPLRWKETAEFTDAGINPILTQNTRGVVIWGARTLSRDPQWLHINSRRIISYVTEQIRRESEWVVFENQTPDLWKIVERMVGARLDKLWNSGLLEGNKEGEQYWVQCDSEVNPPEIRDAGQIHCRVALKPIGTAEFVVVELRLG